MKLGESLEDYLETLLILEETGKIRCVDVASRMHVSKPSVNKAMNVLKDKGMSYKKAMEIFISPMPEEIWQKVFICVMKPSAVFYKMYLVSVLKMLMRMPVTLNMSSVRRPFKN